MANQIKLTVGGINYTVKSDDSAEYLEELGNELEQRLRLITKRNPTLSTTMVAILAALESLDEAKKLKAELAELKCRLSKQTERQNERRPERQQEKNDRSKQLPLK